MPKNQLTRGLSVFTSSFFERLLCLLEQAADEAFWNALFGERVLNLFKRYFGSDVIFLGFIVYLAPILGYRLNSIVGYAITQVRERMYVSIQIGQEESGFDAIQEFIATKTAQVKNLRDVEGRCIDEDDKNSENNNDVKGPSSPPKLCLFPLDETEQKIYYKNYSLWVTKKKNGVVKKDHSYDFSNNFTDLLGMMNSNPCIQVTMRGQDMQLLKSFIQEWINMHFEKEHGKLTIYKCVPTRYEGFEWRTMGSKQLRSFDSVILKEGQKEDILKDIQTFRRREHWYSIRGIPYRRGYLLYGPPGTGKTSLVQSVASKVNMNVAIISLSGTMDDERFNVLLQEVPRNSILVMEDIDHCVIKDPNSKMNTNDAKISMSGLLNALDGVVAQEGSMIFMTCNDVNRLQPALLRPGRIDMKMALGYADKAQTLKMFWRFMGKDDTEENFAASIELNDLAQKFIGLIPDGYVTPAELQNFFIMNMMDHKETLQVEDRKVPIYSYLLEAVPAFLKTVKRDREQAAEHKANNDKPAVVVATAEGVPAAPSVVEAVLEYDTSANTLAISESSSTADCTPDVSVKDDEASNTVVEETSAIKDRN